MNAGRLIALEGLDGCGKTTQAARLAAALRSRGRELVLTREPTDGPYGRRIRAVAKSGDPLTAEQERELFTEDRREHVARVVEPALAAGRWVLTDRYFLSTVAYQGARGLDWREILRSSEAEFPVPDLALLFDLPAVEGLARARARRRAGCALRAGGISRRGGADLCRDRSPLSRARRRVGQRRGGDRTRARRLARADRDVLMAGCARFARFPALRGSR